MTRVSSEAGDGKGLERARMLKAMVCILFQNFVVNGAKTEKRTSHSFGPGRLVCFRASGVGRRSRWHRRDGGSGDSRAAGSSVTPYRTAEAIQRSRADHPLPTFHLLAHAFDHRETGLDYIGATETLPQFASHAQLLQSEAFLPDLRPGWRRHSDSESPAPHADDKEHSAHPRLLAWRKRLACGT